MYKAMYIKLGEEDGMARMVRKQLYIERRQDELLKDQAKQLGVSEAELVRRAIDEAVSPAPLRRQRLRLPPDSNAWVRQEEFIRKHRLLQVERIVDRGWTREELYEERLGRGNG